MVTTSRKLNKEPFRTHELPAQPRNQSLDGLRGAAVLLVLLYHHHLLNAGWMGVDLFFVLSGYLITSILRRTRTQKLFWRGFWIKRSTRILPPFLLLVIATSLVHFRFSWLQAIAYIFSLGDVLAYIRPTFEPLRPLWSLAVEEHFYLLWPFAVRFLHRRSLVWILISLLVFEPLARAVASAITTDWQLVYFLTPFRLDGLALGCVLSLGFESPRFTVLAKRWSGPGTVACVTMWGGLRMSLGHGFTRDQPTATYNSLCYSLVALACSSSIAYLLLHPECIAARVLSWKPLVFTGTISYGFYLYQVLVREMLTRSWHLTARRVLWLDTPIIFLVSWLSFTFVESPCIRWGRKKATHVAPLQTIPG